LQGQYLGSSGDFRTTVRDLCDSLLTLVSDAPLTLRIL
jgi:hypothetical protein